MTSSKGWHALFVACLCAHGACVWAALGETLASVDREAVQTGARRSMAAMTRYTMQEMQTPNGSRVVQYLGGDGLVFAVRWNTHAKPDLSVLLGKAFPSYASAAQVAAQRGGIQRQFRHDDADLVVQSSGHLQAYAGYAYRRSLLPQGVSAASLGWE
jgi:hypothetical protein